MATALTAPAHKDFAPRIRPAASPPPEQPQTPDPACRIEAPKAHDFAPRIRPTTSSELPATRFSHLKHLDLAPVIRRVKRYYNPESPLIENWRPLAACRGQGNTPEGIARWYPGRGGAHTGKVFCAVCPVERECGQFADEVGEEWGIWGNEIRHRRKKAETPQ